MNKEKETTPGASGGRAGEGDRQQRSIWDLVRDGIMPLKSALNALNIGTMVRRAREKFPEAFEGEGEQGEQTSTETPPKT